MVHWGGQEQRPATTGSPTRGRSALGCPCGWRSPGRHAAASIALGFALVLGASSNAVAQAAIGFQGGVALDPEQVFGGVFYQTGDLGRGFRLRPGIDGARGEGWRIATINTDFVYGIPLGANGWTLLAGGGPSVVVSKFPAADFSDTGVGFHSIVGLGHDSGFFAEFRLGSGRAQQLKIGVGWAIALN